MKINLNNLKGERERYELYYLFEYFFSVVLRVYRQLKRTCKTNIRNEGIIRIYAIISIGNFARSVSNVYNKSFPTLVYFDMNLKRRNAITWTYIWKIWKNFISNILNLIFDGLFNFRTWKRIIFSLLLLWNKYLKRLVENSSIHSPLPS